MQKWRGYHVFDKIGVVDRLDLSGSLPNNANTDGGMIKAGTSAARIINDTAAMKFISIYTDCGATSGDSRGMYLRHYITGAGGGGEAARLYTTVENVAGATAHGAHIALSFAATGSITGLGVAMRATLQIPNGVMTYGTYAAVMGEIWSDGSASDPSGVTELAFIRLINGGDGAGIAKVDDKAYLLTLEGGSTSGGNVVVASTTEANYALAARCKLNGTEAWLMFASVSG